MPARWQTRSRKPTTDERSDIFSLGAVLYEMVSRRPAFSGSTVIDILNAVVRTDPEPSDSSPALDRVIRRCLQKDPARRFATMEALRAALESARPSTQTAPTETRRSIAVLPFADMSPEHDHEWFSDGLSEEIINALTHITGLKVIARTSAFAFKGKQDAITNRWRRCASRSSRDPLNASWLAVTASHMVHAGLMEQAVLQAYKALEIDENNSVANFVLVEAHCAQGLWNQALAAAERAFQKAPWNAYARGAWAGLLARNGDTHRAEALMRPQEAAHAFGWVLYHLLRSDLAAAAAAYERAIDQRELFSITFAAAPLVQQLRDSPHWPTLARLMNL